MRADFVTSGTSLCGTFARGLGGRRMGRRGQKMRCGGRVEAGFGGKNVGRVENKLYLCFVIQPAQNGRSTET